MPRPVAPREPRPPLHPERQGRGLGALPTGGRRFAVTEHPELVQRLPAAVPAEGWGAWGPQRPEVPLSTHICRKKTPALRLPKLSPR